MLTSLISIRCKFVQFATSTITDKLHNERRQTQWHPLYVHNNLYFNLRGCKPKYYWFDVMTSGAGPGPRLSDRQQQQAVVIISFRFGLRDKVVQISLDLLDGWLYKHSCRTIHCYQAKEPKSIQSLQREGNKQILPAIPPQQSPYQLTIF